MRKNLMSHKKHSLLMWLLIIGIASACLLSHTITAHAFLVTQCAGPRYGSDLGCTANDVSITNMRVVGDITSCTGGDPVTLDLEMTINFQPGNKYDVGIFISNDGKDPQLTVANGGATSCSVSVLPPSSPFLNLDGPTDTCGDGNKADIGGGTGSGIHYMPNTTVACQALAGSGGNLYIPFVVSWDQSKTPPGAICTSNADPVPGTSSKCNSPLVAQGTVTVVVMPTITNSDGVTFVSSGDTVNYSVVITNTTGVTLSGAVFKDPAVTNITVNSVSCSAAGGATCPGSVTVADMQGAGGITIPNMPANATVTFTINATLTGAPPDTLTNTASVTVGTQTKSASDTDTVVGTIAIIPTTLSEYGSQGTLMVFNYTLYNFASCTSATTTLSNNIDNSQTTIANVASTSGFPSQGRIQIDTEYILYTGITATSFTGATRGYQGTTAANHNSGATVSLLCSNDTISLSPVSNQGWTYQIRNAADTADITSLTVPAGGSSNFIIKVQIPGDASEGTVDVTTITAGSGNNPSKTATATAVTTVSGPLTLTPDNEGAGGQSSSVFYDHRVRNNTASSQTVTFSYAFLDPCTGWTTVLPSFVIVSPFGGYQDVTVRVNIPSGAALGDVCRVTVTATAAPSGNTATATDTTTVKGIVLYSDPAYTNESYIYPAGNSVYGRTFGTSGGTTRYRFLWYGSDTLLKRTSPCYSGPGTLNDYVDIPAGGPLGRWSVEVWSYTTQTNCTNNNPSTLFAQTNFYVGPDHLKASYTYTGANPGVNSNVPIDLALHGKDHLVPLDPSSGNVVSGSPSTKDPLKITVTVSGSATITEYCNPTCTAITPAQTVTFNLPATGATKGTATITITASDKGPVTITPDTYNSALYGSSIAAPNDRDESAQVTFVRRRMRILIWREVQ